MDDYARLGGMKQVGEMPGKIWKIQKKRKPTERKHNRNKNKGNETAGKDILSEKHEQNTSGDPAGNEQETEFETGYGTTPLKKKKAGKIDLII